MCAELKKEIISVKCDDNEDDDDDDADGGGGDENARGGVLIFQYDCLFRWWQMWNTS